VQRRGGALGQYCDRSPDGALERLRAASRFSLMRGNSAVPAGTGPQGHSHLVQRVPGGSTAADRLAFIALLQTILGVRHRAYRAPRGWHQYCTECGTAALVVTVQIRCTANVQMCKCATDRSWISKRGRWPGSRRWPGYLTATGCSHLGSFSRSFVRRLSRAVAHTGTCLIHCHRVAHQHPRRSNGDAR
jgi:hypothetical protein